MQKQKSGFTLIEVLIVISIIAVLASILIVAVMGTIDPVKIRTTDRRIKIIEDGLKRFVDMFESRKNVAAGTNGRGYPRREEFAGITINKRLVDDMSNGEFLRVLLYPTDDELKDLSKFGITKRVFATEEISEMLTEIKSSDENNNKVVYIEFVDPWGFPFEYKFPGDNHSLQTNWKDQKGYNHQAKLNPKPDIWSLGLNNLQDSSDAINDPFLELDDSENDDITNWFVNER